jgi:hypothetical protein
MRFTHVLLAAAAMFALASSAAATSVCVASKTDLRNALNAWQTASDQTYQIKVVQGTYLYPDNDYWSQVYYGGNAKLQLLGGYTANCAGRSLLATNTVLDGQQATAQNSSFQINANGGVTIEGITFKSFSRNVAVSSESTDAADSIVVRYVIGTDLFGAAQVDYNYGGFGIYGKSNVRVESSLFYDVHGGDTASALEVSGFTDNFNAIVTNVTAAYNGARGMQLECFECSGTVKAYNNILYNNTSGDLDTRNNGGTVTVYFSDINPAKVAGTYTAIGNVNVDPRFENPLNNDFLLAANSPLINAGALESDVPGGYPNQDLGGGVRVVGSRVDLGAYETAVNDLVAQSVSSTGDDAFGATLRAAVTTANQNANATTINFNLASSANCPQYIYLATALDDITTDVTINGFSEPGAKANTQYLDYDGRICVIVRASNASVDHALKVSGAGRLTLKGIEFEGFATAAVRLAAGSGSVITGNGFSAAQGSTANGAGVRVEGTAHDNQIGGLTPGNRNVFDQGGAGVDFESNGTARNNLVQGNWFGFNFDGSAWTGPSMTYGIYLLASGGNTLSYNSIGNMNSNGIRLTGSNAAGNTITANGIGIAPDGSAAANLNAGIGIASSAHGTIVGAPGGQGGGGNYIVSNFGPGVWIENTAGNGNRVDGNNVIHDNSGFLAVDLSPVAGLAGLGPTGNDAGDVDSGANKLQNYPYLTEARRIEANIIELDGYILPEALGSAQNYRLDVYWTDSCIGTGPDTPRGEMKRYVGFFYVYANGAATFVTFPFQQVRAPVDIPKNGYLFAIATDAGGSTSEPGKCYPFTDDYIFTNGFN